MSNNGGVNSAKRVASAGAQTLMLLQYVAFITFTLLTFLDFYAAKVWIFLYK
jgi:hypothetical protein